MFLNSHISIIKFTQIHISTTICAEVEHSATYWSKIEALVQIPDSQPSTRVALGLLLDLFSNSKMWIVIISIIYNSFEH